MFVLRFGGQTTILYLYSVVGFIPLLLPAKTRGSNFDIYKFYRLYQTSSVCLYAAEEATDAITCQHASKTAT